MSPSLLFPVKNHTSHPSPAQYWYGWFKEHFLLSQQVRKIKSNIEYRSEGGVKAKYCEKSIFPKIYVKDEKWFYYFCGSIFRKIQSGSLKLQAKVILFSYNLKSKRNMAKKVWMIKQLSQKNLINIALQSYSYLILKIILKNHSLF